MRMDFNGNIDRIIELPCTWPTSCTFGGRNLDVLFITSARFTMTPTHLRRNPLEGSLLCIKPGARGIPANKFLLS